MKHLFQKFIILAVVAIMAQMPLSGWSKKTKKTTPTVSNTNATHAVKPIKFMPKVGGVTKAAKPDLVVSKINFSPGKPLVNDEITLWVFVKNIGQGPAEASGVRVKIGGESNPPVIPVPPLGPGKEFRYTVKQTFSHPINIIVTATADANNALAESNEGNNIKQKVIKVRPAPKPDLTISKINFSNASPKQHEQIRVWIFVKNIGPGKSPAYRCKVSMTDSLNSSPIWSDKLVPALDPGKEWRWDAYFISNSAGTYTITAVVDRFHNVDETNENNNSMDKVIVVRPAN